MPENPIYDFLKANNLTQKDEKAFLKEYSDSTKAKELYSFFQANKLTDKDFNSFYDVYLKKKELPTRIGKFSALGSLAGESETPSTELQTGGKIGSAFTGDFAGAITKPKPGIYPKTNIDFDIAAVSERSKKPELDVKQYNKKFEEATGVADLNLGVSSKSILGGEKKEDKFLSKESLSDAAKYQKYRQVEEDVINPVLSNIYSGKVEPGELKSLYNNEYGKKILLNVLEQELPGVSKIGLDEDVFGNEAKWEQISKQLQYWNRQKGIEAQEQTEEQIAADLTNVFSNYTYGKEDYVSERKGDKPELKETKIPFRVSDINDVAQLQGALDDVERMPFVWDNSGNKVDKKAIKERLQSRIFQLQAGKEIDKEILDFKDVILNAVDKVPLDWKKQGGSPDLVQKDAEYVMAGLNYLKDTKPGEYKMIMASMATNGKISETQFTQLANLGIELKNYKDFKGGRYIASEKRSMLTPQYKKAILSGWLSERLEKEGYRNRSAYSTKEILSAYQNAPEDIKDDEVLSEIIKAERAPSFGFLPIPQGEGVVKKGALNSIFEGFANPIKSILNTVSTVVDSPFEAYLKSKELDRGGQTILNKKGEFTTTLENNFWNKALEGAASLFMQVGLARGLGLLAKTPINAAIGRVNPMATMTTSQAALNIGTPLSTLAQTYGYEYVDFLEKTGSPAKAALGAFVSGSVQGWIEKNVMPDVKIAENINLLTARRNFAKEVIDVVNSGGGQAKLGVIAKKFLDNTAKTLGKEAWGEEVLQNFTNYITEVAISPKTGVDRNILKESLDTGLQATNAMILPALLGAAGQTKISRQLSKAGLNMIAAYPKEYLEAMDSQLARGEISKQDYDLATNIINLHRENSINAPQLDVNGKPISADGQLEYAYQSTVEAINTEKLNQIKDPIQREPIEKKIKEANDIKRKIFNGKEAEIITDIEEVKIDQDRDLMDEPELKGDELKAAKILGAANLPEIMVAGAEQDPLGTLRDIAYQAQGIVINTETGKQELHPNGGQRQSLIDMGVPPTVIDKAVEMFPSEAEAPAIGSNTLSEVEKSFTKEGGNKVVDDNGEPITLYHGTSKTFDNLDATKPQRGLFFTSNKKTASSYANTGGDSPRIISVNLSMKNPHIIDAKGKSYDRILVDLNKVDMATGKWVSKTMSTDQIVEALRGMRAEEIVTNLYGTKTKADGIIIKNVKDALTNNTGDAADVYIPFNNEQIKNLNPKSKPLQSSKPVEGGSNTLRDVDEITVGEMIDKTGTYKGKKGSFYKDGQAVVFKVEGENKEYELGNIDEIKNNPISSFDIKNEQSVVGVNDRGNIEVRGNEYVNNYSYQLAAINKDKDGNFISVNLETPDGKKRTFRGSIGEDIAYQIYLKEINKNNETRSEFEQHLNEDAAASKEMEDGGLSQTSKTTTTENNAKVSREKVQPKVKPQPLQSSKPVEQTTQPSTKGTAEQPQQESKPKEEDISTTTQEIKEVIDVPTKTAIGTNTKEQETITESEQELAAERDEKIKQSKKPEMPEELGSIDEAVLAGISGKLAVEQRRVEANYERLKKAIDCLWQS